jgi:hypothetical protein
VVAVKIREESTGTFKPSVVVEKKVCQARLHSWSQACWVPVIVGLLYVSPAIHRGCVREVFSSEIIHSGPLPDSDVVVTVKKGCSR